MLPAALLAAAALVHLRARRLVGLPRTAINRWRQTPLLGKILVCLLFAQFSYDAVTKPLRNPPPAREATGVSLPRGAPLRGSGTLAASPADELGVSATNLCFAAIERGTNSTALLLAWPPAIRPPLDRVGLFAALELPGPWTHLFDIDISTCASNALVEVTDDEISTNSPSAAFFRLGDPAPPDSDGDGLSDVEEAGEITVRNEFEWYDTTGFSTTYAPPPEGGLGSYLGASLIANLSGSPVIDGVVLTQAFAFENGFVSLQAPGDWYGAVFPSVPRPLCYRPYYSGSIVVAPYWGVGYVQYGNTNSYMRAGTLADGTAVVEFHGVKRNRMSSEGMTCQVIIPGGTALKNDPVCYAGGIIPTVKVKFGVSPDLDSARLSARAVGADSPLGGLEAVNVEFSIGRSTWFEFRADSRIPRTVRKADHRWEWRVSMIGNNNVTAFVCATTGPHRVYTVLDVPKEPWEPNGIIEAPWADALELACTVAEGKSDKVQALAAITTHLFQNMHFVYDIEEGTFHYFEDEQSGFSFNSYICHRFQKVNCSDQAYGLATFGNLMGIHSTIVMTQPVGYINTVNLVGVGPCNNPVYLGTTTTNHLAVCGPDDTSRSKFTRHRYVFAEGVVFDACIGPALGTQTRLEYLRSVIDSSTEAERIWSPYSPFGSPSTTAFEIRNYSIIGVK